jgi:hypothetical protein
MLDNALRSISLFVLTPGRTPLGGNSAQDRALAVSDFC